ncbi:MAG: 30S ribosomal protein S18 [Eggerthellaceae bacterium]|nr:30S ribosomal protein S18 [Eggerthellaceae bacterium]
MSDYKQVYKKKTCLLCKEIVEYLDYKDTKFLSKYITDRGKIKPGRVTGNCTQHQKMVAKAVKRAREMVLMPYVVSSISNRGDRRRRSSR